MSRPSLFGSPLLLGFEEFERAIERLSKHAGDSYPPYNVEQHSKSHLRIVLAVAGFAGILTWAERRQSAFIQDRLGPNRANVFGITLFGLLHPLADGIKMMTKEDFTPAGADRIIHTLAPFMALFRHSLHLRLSPSETRFRFSDTK